ncbi:transcriptional regulator [Clostridium sp. MF28]|uniref:helix-turn-helix transcriptional regulator n=1 Tax=Clostridium TaxID=1485 RepID=UPI000CF953DB|nr:MULTISPECIES: helix-turn-helix transcriptional regulator [Clostridium]AVK51166.1 transcriptional regulator [Clostridium sp. MF28]PSM55905.1 transcriptional regulator [Clostridium diolis]
MYNEKQRYKELGDFLKSRRAKILPSQVGMPEGIRRRTPGLRREEVALLSGIGLTWYTWIEQGRPIQISIKALESLAKALMLDKEETKHLYILAQHTPPTDFQIYGDNINPMFQHVLDSLEFSPATIQDARFNVISWNRASAKIILDYDQMNVSKRNMLRIMFTNEEYKKKFTDWEVSAKKMIASFRTMYGEFVGDPWIENLITELRNESKEFDSWWSMYDIKKDEGMLKNINHPILGELEFEHTIYMLVSDSDLKMSILTAVPGSDTEKKIKQFLLK